MTPTANKNRYHGLSHVQAIQFINLNFQTKTKQNKNKKNDYWEEQNDIISTHCGDENKSKYNII